MNGKCVRKVPGQRIRCNECMTGWMTRVSILTVGRRFFSSPECPGWLWSSPSGCFQRVVSLQSASFMLGTRQIKKTEMGRVCSAYVGEERCIQGFSGKT